MSRQIDLYQEMSRVSVAMVAAAREGDWEALIELERGVARLRETLMSMPEDANIARADLLLKRQLIEHILDNDAEIRRHTEPWMEHVRHLLGDNQRLRELHRSYPATGEAARRP
jgi:flagellar protein FliT